MSTTTLPKFTDTHTHLLQTLSIRNTPQVTLQEFVSQHYAGKVDRIVDIWCDVPVGTYWKQVVDLDFAPLQYSFAIGAHPSHAHEYTNTDEENIIEALAHPRCVALGEIGLDYHQGKEHRTIQIEVLRRQLKIAIRLNKPLVIHTRQADEDIVPILIEEVPVHWKIHVHCFTDAYTTAEKLMAHFPNLKLGITGVLTFRTATNTQELAIKAPLHRLLLETDSPYMVPSNLPKRRDHKYSHSAMIPWTALRIAELRGIEQEEVLSICEQNSTEVYGSKAPLDGHV